MRWDESDEDDQERESDMMMTMLISNYYYYPIISALGEGKGGIYSDAILEYEWMNECKLVV